MFKVLKITSLSLIIISFLLLIAFFLTMGQGGDSILSTAGESLHVPLLTDAIFFWLYFLFAVAIVITILFAIIQFTKSMISNPKSSLKTLLPILAFALIFIVSFFLGNGEKISIIGYEGTQNEGIWAQLTDMFLYTTYALFVIIFLTIFGSRIYVSLK